MKNVLIISYDFPPVNNIASRRFGYMVKYFEQYGWRPWVITLNGSGNLPQLLDESRIFRIGEHSQLSENVENLKASHHLRGGIGLVHSLLRKSRFSLLSVDRHIFTWYKQVAEQQAEIMKALPQVDLVVATFGPASALWLGRKFAKLYNAPWIADFRDVGAQLPDWLGRSNFARWVDMKIEGKLLSSASRVITVSETLAEMYTRTYGKKTSIIYNGWDESDWPREEDRLSNTPSMLPYPYMYFAGRIYEYHLDSVKRLLTVLKENGKISLVMRSLGPVKYEKVIMDYADQLGVGHLLKMLPSCTPDTVYYEAQFSITNVVFEDLRTDIEWSRGTLTGKLFTLLPLRPPMICIARPDSDMGAIMQKTGKGRLVSSVNEISRYLQDIESLKACSGNENSVCDFSRQAQAEKAARVFDEVVRKTR